MTDPTLTKLRYDDLDSIELDGLIEVLTRLLDDTVWPKSEQGEFIDYATRDVHELCCAAREEAKLGRWLAAITLLRPLQERSEYSIAAAISPSFVGDYLGRTKATIESDFNAKPRALIQAARGIIDNWAVESRGVDGFMKSSVRLNRIGSTVQHDAIGWSSEHESISINRPGFLETLSGRVLIALIHVLIAIQAIDAHGTDAWRKAAQVVQSGIGSRLPDM